MMPGKNGVAQVIKVTLTSFAAVALALRLSLIVSVFDHVVANASRASYPFWPPRLANQLVALGIINEPT